MRLITVVLFLLALPVVAGELKFGYFHTNEAAIVATRDHTNLVSILTADPETASLDRAAELHPSADLVLEFGALIRRFKGTAGCEYNKCLEFNANRVKAILDAVEKAILPYQNRIFALYIVDEPETNPPTLEAIDKLVDAIKARKTLASIPLWVNYDNVYSGYTGVEFRLSDGIDIVSLTPTFGLYCGYRLCETGRYTVLLNAVQRGNKSRTAPYKLMVVGDGWSTSPDVSGASSLSNTGMTHLYKADVLYSLASRMAGERGIEVLGELVFAYSTPGEYTIENSHSSVKDKWRSIGKSFINPTHIITPPNYSYRNK